MAPSRSPERPRNPNEDAIQGAIHRHAALPPGVRAPELGRAGGEPGEDTTTCPHCHWVAPRTAEACPSCGHRLELRVGHRIFLWMLGVAAILGLALAAG